MTARWDGWALCAVLALPLSVAAIGQQSRDATPPAQTAPAAGTAVLSGSLVIDEADSHPVRRAVIHLAGREGSSTRLAATDDDGRFVLTHVPAGSYSLWASKPGYVTTYYGSRHPGRGPGVPIAIGAGERLSISLRMLHGATITGTIADARGRPVSNLPVQAVEMDARQAAVAPTTSAVVASTDDRGIYRIYGLAPGTYLVAAVPNVNGLAAAGVSVTDDEVQWVRGQTSSANRAPASTLMPPTGPSVTYAPVFYPGTADAGQAATITIAAGEERAGVSFTFPLVPTARVAGTTIDWVGQPLSGVSLTLAQKHDASVAKALASLGAPLPRAVVSGNAFAFAGVIPGEYTLIARTGGIFRSRVGEPAADTLWGSVELTVAGSDQTDVVVRLTPGTKVSGSIAFEGTSLKAPDDKSQVTLALTPVDSVLGLPSPTATVAPTGAFTFSSVMPSAYELHVSPPVAAPGSGRHWTLKSALLNGHDRADGPWEVKPGEEVTGLIITFSDQAAQIDGTVVDASGHPVAAYSVVVFPTDRSLWLPSSRRIKAVHLATDGTFSVSDLPMGQYCVAVVDNLDSADLGAPDFLAELQAASTTLNLAEGEHKIQNLKVGGSQMR